jgi:hypothetical protein
MTPAKDRVDMSIRSVRQGESRNLVEGLERESLDEAEEKDVEMSLVSHASAVTQSVG